MSFIKVNHLFHSRKGLYAMTWLCHLLILSVFTSVSDHDKDTVQFLLRSRQADGGYGQTGNSTLTSTSAALRALKYFGGTPEGLAQTRQYVWSCFHKQAGAFSDQPGGQPHYRATATGIMAVVALGERFTPVDLSRLQITLFNSNQPEEIRLGAAAIETLVLDGQLEKVPTEWQSHLTRVFRKDRGTDDLYGQGPGRARMTAGYVAAFLRLGFPVAEKENILQLIKSSQHQSGGWTNDQGHPDLEASYRVMRCLYLMQCKDLTLLDRCEKFITSCKQTDGGYGIPPANTSSKRSTSISSISGTYFCGSMLHWIRELRK